ncbi:MAG: hypothetical protein WA840_01080 [Caulobacteraceae bacterium]
MTISNPVTSASIAAEFGFGAEWGSANLYAPSGAGASAPRELQDFAGFTDLQFSGGANQNIGLITAGVTSFALTCSPIDGAGGYTYSWGVISAPSTCSFASPNSQSTSVATGAFGTYVLGCTVTDAWGAQRLCEFEATTQAVAGGNPGNCVAIDSFMSTGHHAARVKVGHHYRVLTADFMGVELAPATGFSISTEPCVRLTSTSGVELDCSMTTPIEWADGRVLAHESLGAPIAVEDGAGFRWERIVRVLYIGPRRVANISFAERIYGAGRVKGQLLYTHNKTQPQSQE